MEGFFNKKETESDARPNGKLYTCISCGRYKCSKTPKMKPKGGFKKGILNIALIPGGTEDRRGEPFQSKEFQHLKEMYNDLGVDLYEDCLNMYCIHCYSDEQPSLNAVDFCRKSTLLAIKKYNPKVIVLFGEESVYSIIGNRWKKDFGGITKWQGWQIPDQELNTWICPTFSLSEIQNPNNDLYKLHIKQDLEKAIQCLDNPFPKYKEPEIIVLEEDELSALDSIQGGTISFDYETTGLKPHAKGHKIICASVSVNKDKVYTFLMPENRRKRKPFTELLKRESVGKIAQNLKYEDTWSKVILKTTVKNWLYDTMIATHIIDNRHGITSLKFQAYVQLGIINYDEEVSQYLHAKDSKNANAFNQIEVLLSKPGGKELILNYCALDSVYEYRLSELTRKSILGTTGKTSLSPIQSDFPNAYRLFHDGILAFGRIERNGFKIDVAQLLRQKTIALKKIRRIESKINESKFYKDWAKFTGFLPILNSGKQLSDYLYNQLKIKPFKFTTGGSGSTDEDALKMLGIPELDMMINRTKLLKLKDTFLDGIYREQVDGVMHPFFHLHTVTTYRSSSSNINFQNLPKRDLMQMNAIRSCIFPSSGNQLFEVDFKGVEVAVSVAYHDDPVMKKYVSDPTTDMHGDMAIQIFKLKGGDKHSKPFKTMRQAAKNGFVFPQFYGDYWKNNAESISRDWVTLPARKWVKTDGIEIKEGFHLAEHLIQTGIKSYKDFEEHLKEIETDFWENRFKVYNKWKAKQWAQYLKNGYVPLKTGFVCKGIMDKKNVTNYPIQGAAFHCLLWTLIHVEREMIELKLKSKIIGQIHDAIVFDLYPPELLIIHEMVQRIGTIELREAYKWINVPLVIETELCPIDHSWAEKEEWKP